MRAAGCTRSWSESISDEALARVGKRESVADRTGTPRKLRVTGCPGESRTSRGTADIRKPQRTGVVDQLSEDTMAFRPVTGTAISASSGPTSMNWQSFPSFPTTPRAPYLARASGPGPAGPSARTGRAAETFVPTASARAQVAMDMAAAELGWQA